MATEVRVGDTVNYHVADGEIATAVVTAITDQDDIDIEYYHHASGATTQANVVRATTWPAPAGEFYKMA